MYLDANFWPGTVGLTPLLDVYSVDFIMKPLRSIQIPTREALNGIICL